MKVTLVDVQQPRKLFSLLDGFEAPVLCGGSDLRHNRDMERLLCSLTAPGKGIPQLELTVSCRSDLSRLFRYMTR